MLYHRKFWSGNKFRPSVRLRNEFILSEGHIKSSAVLQNLIFTRKNTGAYVVYTYTDQYYYSMLETVEHRNIRCKNALNNEEDLIIDVVTDEATLMEEEIVSIPIENNICRKDVKLC